MDECNSLEKRKSYECNNSGYKYFGNCLSSQLFMILICSFVSEIAAKRHKCSRRRFYCLALAYGCASMIEIKNAFNKGDA